MTNPDLEAWFKSVSESQRETLQTLRAIILSAGPGVVEEIKWGRPCYSVHSKLFSYLHSTKHHATIGFQSGAWLSDPEGLLEGEGKGMRHIKIRPNHPVNSAALTALISEAYEAAI